MARRKWETRDELRRQLGDQLEPVLGVMAVALGGLMCGVVLTAVGWLLWSQ